MLHLIFALALTAHADRIETQGSPAGPAGASGRASCKYDPQFKDVSTIPSGNIKVKLAYLEGGSEIMKDKKPYECVGDPAKCCKFDKGYLHEKCWQQLADAGEFMKKTPKYSCYNLVVKDAMRPVSAQKALWEAKPDPDFVAQPSEDPAKMSMHNLGLAVDITLEDCDGKELPMGTPFDDTTKLTYRGPEAEAELTKAGKGKDVANRKDLDNIMASGKFKPYSKEWWHFNCMDRKDAGGFQPAKELP